MEYFDLLDKNRNYMNKILPRGTKLEADQFNQGCEVFIIVSNNKILLTQRSKFKSHPLMWEAPGGCTIAGETTLETAKREINEEIGLNIKVEDFKFLSTELYNSQFIDIYMVKSDSLNLLDLKLQQEEISQAKIVTFAELEKMIENNQVVKCTKNDYLAIKKYLIY